MEHKLNENGLYELNEDTHELHNVLTGEIIDLPSTTQIVNEIYPFDVSVIDPTILERSQIKGTCVHRMLELHILKEDGKEQCEHGFYSHRHEAENGRRMINKILKRLDSDDWQIQPEKIMVGKKYTGISDFVAYNFKTKSLMIYDWKTTSRLHKDKEAMQASLYAKLFKETENLPVENVFLGIVNTHVNEEYSFTIDEINKGMNEANKGLKMFYSK